MSRLWVDSVHERRMQLAHEWDDLVAAVRARGFEDFLRPKPLAALLPAAEHGPVAMVNISASRCDALLVHPDRVDPCALPGLTAATVVERANHYLAALRTLDQAAQQVIDTRRTAAVEPSHASASAAHRAREHLHATERSVDTMLTGLTAWLWDTVAEPVLRHLNLMTAPVPGRPWPRVWWCPTGPMSLLPLHAAGHHDTSEYPATVLDLCMSSYTPTLGSLIEARNRADTTASSISGSKRVLLVGVRNATGRARLRAGRSQESVLRRLIRPDRLKVLKPSDLNRDTVIEELGRHHVVHFDCHGDQNLADPSASGLVLPHDTVTVLDIAARSWRADFAGLAACKTAVGGVKLLDESISLAAALHYTGYQHVVGTLWSVLDTVTTELFTELYSAMYTTGDLDASLSPAALHQAVRALRNDHRTRPRLWAPFIHVGP